MFRRDRFQLLLKFFHVVDNSSIPDRGSPNYNPAAKFQPVVDHANSVFKLHYLPSQFLSIDESLVGTCGRSSMVQYMPNKKHSRFGVKLWMIMESATKYCYQFFVYRGKKYDPSPACGQGYDVVMRLLRVSNLLNRAYHVVIDNFFTSIKLCKDLFSKGTFLTGTLRRNRIPSRVKSSVCAPKQTRYFRQEHFLLTAFRPKKSKKNPVTVLSSSAEARNIIVKNHLKPSVIHEIYNPNMCGVDVHDQMLYLYHDERKSVKVWKKVVFNLLGRMLLNSYTIYLQNTSDSSPLSRKMFNLAVIDALANDHLRTHATGKSSSTKAEPGVRRLPGSREKDCCVCSDRKLQLRRRSKTVCVICLKGLHLTCASKHKICSCKNED